MLIHSQFLLRPDKGLISVVGCFLLAVLACLLCALDLQQLLTAGSRQIKQTCVCGGGACAQGFVHGCRSLPVHWFGLFGVFFSCFPISLSERFVFACLVV